MLDPGLKWQKMFFLIKTMLNWGIRADWNRVILEPCDGNNSSPPLLNISVKNGGELYVPASLYKTTFSFRFVTKWRQQFLYIYFGPSVAQHKKYKRLWKVVFSISCTDFFFRALTTDKLCSVFYSLVYTHSLGMKKCYLL